ncbi:MAG: Amuc_1100 family pilus-like protein [Cephaloticoccus sp.]|nr:Amuc_1100 family pilus-like protein [Cephaloticoccus sp.]MCF7760111.1 Amuc_1100 family pilus-like protein [Cephaloticoccus sp.]
MTTIRRHPWFTLGLLVAGLTLLVEGYWLYLSRQVMQRAETRLTMRKREWGALQRVAPKPTPEVEQAIAADVAKAEQILTGMRTTLRGGPAAEVLRQAVIPTLRTDAFFALANYVQAMEAAARVNGVAVAADERFGFKSYVNEGPAVEQIPTVIRQSQILHHALTTLFAARPLRLVAVLRTMPLDGKPAVQRRTEGGRDGFELAPRLSVQRPGHINTLGFQVEFTGMTAVLRTWLNALAAFDLPLVVRAIEVQPVTGSPGMPTQTTAMRVTGKSGNDQLVPLVLPVASNFKVTFEYIELEPATEGNAW